MKSLQELLMAIDIDINSKAFLKFFASHLYFGSDFNSFFKSLKKNNELQLYTEKIPLFSIEQGKPTENLDEVKMKPDILLAFNGLPIMPIQLERHLQ